MVLTWAGDTVEFFNRESNGGQIKVVCGCLGLEAPETGTLTVRPIIRGCGSSESHCPD
jgi:hypothetical protein